MSDSPCPREDELLAFTNGTLPVAQADSIVGHLDSCRQCLQAIEQLSPAKDSVLAQLAASGPNLQFQDEPPLAEIQLKLGGSARDASTYDEMTQTMDTDADPGLASPMPATIGDYELLGVLGEGGMGIVYKAHHRKLKRLVAVKTVRPQRFEKKSSIERLFIEAESAAKLDHPGIVPIYETGQSDGLVYFSMRYLPGGTLTQAVKSKGLDNRQAAQVMRDIAIAVQHAHSRGLIHRDLKPSNILLDEEGHPLVADFGLAKAMDSLDNLTMTGEVLGTPTYMSPEQACGTVSDLTTSSDIYSLGGILFFLLTGRSPFVGNSALDVLHQLKHNDPVRPSEINTNVHRDLETITLKCLSKSPSERYASASDLADELDRFLQNRPILARPVGPMVRSWRWCLRNPALATMVALVVGSLVVGASVSTYFGVLAQARATSLTKSNESLVIAKAEAVQSAADAEEKAKFATEQADVALKGFETILYDLQNTLVENPAALGQRRRLLKQVIDQLDRLPNNMAGQARFQRCNGTALLTLAEVAMEGGDDEGLSGMTASRRFYESAVEIFRELNFAHPNDPTYARDLAEALTEYGDTTADARGWPAAVALFQEAEPLYEELMEAPLAIDGRDRSRSANIDWAMNQVLCGEAFTELKQFDSAKQYLTSGYQKMIEVVAEHPRDKVAGLALGRAIRKLGDWNARSGDSIQAEARFTEFASVTSGLVTLYPLDIECRLENSTAYERLGNVQRSRGDRKAAKESYIKSLDLAASLETAAKDSVRLQWDISFSYQKVAEICVSLKQWDEAFQAAKKCADIRLAVQRSDPSGRWFVTKLNHSLSVLATIHRRRSEWDAAINTYQTAIDVLTAFQEHAQSTQYRDSILAFRNKIAECRQLAGQSRSSEASD